MLSCFVKYHSFPKKLTLTTYLCDDYMEMKQIEEDEIERYNVIPIIRP